MSFSNKKITPVAAGILLALSCSTSSAEVILNFNKSAVNAISGTDFTFLTCQQDFKASTEYRMCTPDNASLGGGAPLDKVTIKGSEVWTFDNTGVFTGVTNTATTGGLSSTNINYGVPTASPNGALATDQGADFFESGFAFLAPFAGSSAATTYGVASIQPLDAFGKNIAVDFPVLEAQWAGTSLPLGQDGSAGISFTGKLSNIVDNGGGAGIKSFDFTLTAEHTIIRAEDPGDAGFADWTGQWYYVGSGTAPDSFFKPPAAPDATGGTLGVTAGTSAASNSLGDGRASLEDIVADYPADTGSDLPNSAINLCNGGCFDFTVSGVTTGASVVVTLPLTASIPDNPVYRKYNATQGWHNFDTSAGDIIESGPADTTTTPSTVSVSCVEAGKIYTTGLTKGNNCVRLTIKDGGSNDNDNTENGTIVDPGGVASNPKCYHCCPNCPPPYFGETDTSGCSISNSSINSREHADWWIVAAFLTLIGVRRKLKQD